MKNRQEAMKMLMSRLIKKQEEEKQKAKDSIVKQKIEWGSQIRSYVLHPYKMVKDHRTDKASSRPDLVLDGELEEFIEDFLVNRPDLG
jgi:peptide chain release factor 2